MATCSRLRWTLSAVLCGAALLSALPARADIRNLLGWLRRGQPEAPQTIGKGPPRLIELNGFPLHLQVGRSADSPRQVVDFYQRSCARSHHSAGPPPLVRRDGADPSLLVGVDGDGDEVRRRMAALRQHFIHTAPLCMVYAHAAGDATDFMAVWSDTPLPPRVLSPPAQGDAPGYDIAGVPRPSGARRSFNLVEPSVGYILVAYVSDDQPEVAFREAVNQLVAEGFAVDGSMGRAAADAGRLLLALDRPGQNLLVSAEPRESGAPGCLILYMARSR